MVTIATDNETNPTGASKQKLPKAIPENLRKSLEMVKNRANVKDYIDSYNDAGALNSFLLRGASADIHPIPDIFNPERREASRNDLKLWNETYFTGRFNLGWSKDHLELIAMMENAIINGGGYSAFACPRGTGKTSLSEAAALWALFHSWDQKKFVVIVGATQPHSVEIYRSILTEIETNPMLGEDFPEVCYPVQCLGGSWVKAKRQHVSGTRTQLEIKADSLSFPYIDGAVTSGSAIQCVSITGRLRGLKRTVPHTGEIHRPDLVLIDDPQTDRSAKSPKQVETRERTVVGSILGLAGPKADITAIMPCTVIAANDLAERFLDRNKRPEWQGKRSKMLISFPTNMELWREYAEIQAESYRNGNFGKEATEFYRENRVAMDEGAEVSWEDRFNDKLEISAIQHAMNLYIRDPKAFAAEYQNEPLIESNGDEGKIELESKKILERVSGIQFGTLHRSTQFLTAGVDIQQRILYYTIVAWSEDFGGSIVDYGTFPRQPVDYYVATNPPATLADALPNLLLGPQVFEALQYFHQNIFSRQYQRDEAEGDGIRLDKILIDANWHEVADAVYAFTKQQDTTNLYMPSHGKGIGASMLPMEQWSKKQGEKPGDNYRIRANTAQKNRGRHVLYDTNYWKTKIAQRLLSHVANPNALLLYGSNGYKHQLIADHCCAEYSVRTHGRGRDVNEWKTKASQGENHYFDCIVQAAVGAAMCGLEFHNETMIVNGRQIAVRSPKKQRRELTAADFVKRK